MNSNSFARCLALLVAAISFTGATQSVGHAQDVWDGGGDGKGTKWDSNGNWVSGDKPVDWANILFDNRNGIGTIGDASATMSLERNWNLNTITFSNINSRLPTTLFINSDTGGSTTRTVTLSGGITLRDTNTTVRFNGNSFGPMNFVLSANNVFDTSGTSTLRLYPVISGGFGITKNGTGAVVLGAANTYSGLTTVNGGTLSYGINNAIAAGGVTINASSTLAMNAFSDTVGQVIVNGGVISGTGTLSSTANFDMRSGSATAVLGGSVGLDKSTAGTFTLANSNTYSGLTTVNAGTLRYAVDNALATGGVTVNSSSILALNMFNDTVGQVIVNGGSITGSGTLSSTADFDMRSGSASAILGGAVGLNKSTAGTFTLNNSNTYSGLTTVNAGTLNYGANNAIAGGGVTVNSGSTLAMNAFSDSVGQVIVNGGSITGSGTLSSTADFDMRSGSASAILGGAVGLNKSTAGTFTLNNSNTYSGTTSVTNGTLVLGNATNTLSNSGAVVVDGGSLALGNNNDTVGSVSLLNGSITGTGGTLNGSSYQVENGLISAKLGGSGSLTKSTSGTVTMSGANNYSGNTTVNDGKLIVSSTGSITSPAGTLNAFGGRTQIDLGGLVNVQKVTVGGSAILNVNGSLSASNGISMSSTSTLNGNGLINADLNLVSGTTLAPGNSIGHLTIGGNLTLAGNYDWEVNSGTSLADLVDVTGTLNLSGSSLSVLETGTFTPGQKFTLFSYGSLAPSQFSGWANNTVQSGWLINYFDLTPGLNGGSGSGYITLLSVPPVPEPTTVFFGLMLAGTLVFNRRRNDV